MRNSMASEGRKDSQKRVKRKILACVRSGYPDTNCPDRLKKETATMMLKKARKYFFIHCSKCGVISTCIRPSRLIVNAAIPRLKFMIKLPSCL